MPTDFSIRVAVPDDENRVSALLEASYPVSMAARYAAAVLECVLPSMTRANPALLAASTYYLAEIEAGGIVACGGWTRERPGDGAVAPGVAHIRHFATHPEYVGRGIARAIYDRCERDARAAGMHRFECYASLNSEGFYAALGFESLRRFELSLASGLRLPAVLMVRSF